MTTLPSAYKGLSSYAIAPLTQPWTLKWMDFELVLSVQKRKFEEWREDSP
jgi:hypothetical protein